MALGVPGRRLLLNAAWMVAATDAALVVLHLATGSPVVDLDREANVATWYSGAKLLAVAALFAAVAHAPGTDRTRKRLWLLGCTLFVGLALDETISLHESLTRRLLELPALAGLREMLTGGDEVKTSYAWVWLLLPAIASTAGFLAWLARRTFRPNALRLFLAGLGSMLLAAGLEAVVVWFPPVAEWGAAQARRYRSLTTVEECAELLGVTLLFVAAALHLGTPRD